jgi:7-carboxy-7-deazaguanine synthase
MYALEGNEWEEMSVPEIISKCKELKNECITLTGGEPLIHKDVHNLINTLSDEGFEVNIETNGSVDISKFMENTKNVFFTVDYKTPYSGEEDKMYMDNFYKYIRSNDVVKFVCASIEDLNKMKDVVHTMKQSLNSLPHIFVSPVFRQIEPVTIVDYLKENNLQDVRMQLQLHKYIWDSNMKGV